jgi:hypothetical protein
MTMINFYKACRVLSLAAIGLIVANVPARAQGVPTGIGYWKGVTAPTFTGTVSADSLCLDATNKDTCLVRDGAVGALAQKNGTAAQTFRIYGTTAGPKYFQIAHTGANGQFLTNAGGGSLQFGANGTFTWQVDSATGHWFAVTDNANDIGAAGSARPRSIFVGTAITAGTSITANTDVIAGSRYILNSKTVINVTAPTVTSAGTSPSVTENNGTISFRVNVGTGGTATTIVMAMPAAANNWNCNTENLTSNAANRANQHVVQQSSTTTAVTVQNQTISTGAALAFTASDIVRFICVAE